MTKSGKLGNGENDPVRKIRQGISEYQYVLLDMITSDYWERIMNVAFMYKPNGGV